MKGQISALAINSVVFLIDQNVEASVRFCSFQCTIFPYSGPVLRCSHWGRTALPSWRPRSALTRVSTAHPRSCRTTVPAPRADTQSTMTTTWTITMMITMIPRQLDTSLYRSATPHCMSQMSDLDFAHDGSESTYQSAHCCFSLTLRGLNLRTGYFVTCSMFIYLIFFSLLLLFLRLMDLF